MRSSRWLTALSPLAFLALWELASRTGLADPRFIPPPSSVARTVATLASTGELAFHVGVSVRRILVGFAAGALPAVILGLAMGLWPPVRAALMPLVASLYPIPKIAVYPLIIVYLGIGEASKVTIVAVSIFFLVLLNTMAGVVGLDRAYFQIARAYGASGWRLFTTVALPGALPQIFTGLKLGMGFALIVIVGAELLGSDAGIGFVIWRSYQIFAVDTMFAGLLVTAILGWAATAALDWLERMALPWRPGPADVWVPGAGREGGEHPGWLRVWWQAVRPFSFTASVTPVLVGTAAAVRDGAFHPGLGAAALLASVGIHAATNLFNDYYDHVRGVDTPESVGPSGVIQQGLLSPRAVRTGAWVLVGASGLLGLVLVAARGWPVLAVGAASVLAGYAYTGGPVPLGYRALGDLVVFVFMGLVIVAGAYFIQTGTVSATAVWAALPVAALVDAILVVNNLRDLRTDRERGKRTLATVLGPRGTRIHLAALLVGTYAAVGAGVLLSRLPPASLVVALTIPQAVRLWQAVRAGGDPLTLTQRGVREAASLHGRVGWLLAAALVWTARW
ncbi:MAG: 1,4-dihydroxy-2-naphthoate octaprenyltransferase [Armatimonadota bacterium]|nr:1,4-dihydroxy-2-naphthoate octaprenyltransferase [Armatimonadota bacterium]MDR7401173.1 1,4-dihydroxy-2-naphthoate octaprenyltransferase [Armatimonadota bacterium]MDR7403407.1 1,4-dihydroxy-2-naphthoate octaprenyltransferase [Armatimonadota bacterium]MDR7438012.1 1,4-dihydroxy-2-naphthoate octaprenyltransferase [Armatimonadota bacterium]MDR7471828.1 1,4-dihydroxy-2-naphthoate octaprenyltransferase [Armatimonadota bacterium]